MWAFVIPLALVSVFANTLLPQALYGLVTKGSTVLLGPYLGLWMDRQPRLKGWGIVRGVNGFSRRERADNSRDGLSGGGAGIQ